MEFKTFDSKKLFIKTSAEIIANSCHTKKRTTTHMALSGGSPPAPIYHYFATTLAEHISNARIYASLVDERYVPITSEQSNWYMIKKNFCDPLPAHPNNPLVTVNMIDTNKPIKHAIKNYTKAIKFDLPPDHAFDLVILGIGTDGHVASLFPHSPVLHSNEWIAHTTTENHPIKDRITMTFELIMRAKKILLLAGPEKKDILDRLLHGDETIEELPAKKLLGHDDFVIHYLL